MGKTSAGLLMYRRHAGEVQVLLVHPGGPLWARKELGAWGIPKGEYGADEDPFAAAVREFQEETGRAPAGDCLPLAPIRQASGKLVRAWALEGDWDPVALRSNTFSMTWPPGSGRTQEFPEVDRAAWFGLDEAKRRILPGQAPLVEELEHLLCDAP